MADELQKYRVESAKQLISNVRNIGKVVDIKIPDSTNPLKTITIGKWYEEMCKYIDDHGSTDELKQACALVEIKLLDHIILGENTFYSYADKGKV